MDEKKDTRAAPAPMDLEQRKQEIKDLVARARESKPDLHDVLPDTAAILREARPDRAQEKLREASLTPLPMGAAERASPWAREAPEAGALDKAALPSAAMAPRDPDDETTLVKGPPLEAAQPRRRFAAVAGVGAVIAVFAPLVLMYVLLVRPNETGHGGVGAAPLVASAAVSSVPSAPSSAAPPAMSVRPAVPASAVPSAQPSVGPATSASVQPAPPAPTGARPKPRGTVDDPYDGATVPSPPKTAPSTAPSATPTVSPSAPTPPPPTPAPTPAPTSSAKDPNEVF